MSASPDRTTTTPAGDYDVVVVGARCAGASIATLLARRGLRVCVVDRARFPSDTASTHIIDIDGTARLGRIGLGPWLRKSGAPFLVAANLEMEQARALLPFRVAPGDPPGAICVRRVVLDQALVDQAAKTGAEVYTGTRVVDVVREAGRVAGVVVQGPDGTTGVLRARLVVGADGRMSGVARLVGARSYNVVRAQRFGVWAYYEGCPTANPEFAHIGRRDDKFVLAARTDSGLTMVLVMPPVDQAHDLSKARLEQFQTDAIAAFENMGALVGQGRRVGPVRAMPANSSFFREATGPGWVLIGDAGRVIDFCTGRGISDALRHAEEVAGVVAPAIADPARLDADLAGWWKRRDRFDFPFLAFWDHYGRADRLGPVEEALIKVAGRQWQIGSLMNDVHARRTTPARLFTPRSMTSVSLEVLRSPHATARGLVREVLGLAGSEARMRWRGLRPRFDPAPPVGPTDITAETRAMSVEGATVEVMTTAGGTATDTAKDESDTVSASSS